MHKQSKKDTRDNDPNEIRPKKSLGQNFLTSQAAFAKILKAAELQGSETVIEVGPGKGALTEKLLAAGARVIAIEKDRRLISFLSEKFAGEVHADRLHIIEGDALDIDPGSLTEKGGAYKLVANIPYYITGALIRSFL
jgi:16S rRNA (adenine1518-N6/adenine1519-N6)-dimethyltransferase